MQSSPQDDIFDNEADNETISTITEINNNIIKPKLTIELQQTIFNNLKLNECPNWLKVKKLITSKLINDNEKTLLKKAYKKSKNNILFVEYSNKKKFGRVFSAVGSSNYSRKIRHTIYDKYVDIDIINCAYSILVSICKSNGMKCKYLKKYVNDRENILKLLSEEYNTDRETVKKLFVSLINSGSFKGWTIEHNINGTETKFINKIINEISLISDVILNNNPKLIKIAEKANKTNIKGSVMSNYIQIYESLILENVYLYCVKNGYIINNNCSLAFDGILLLKEFYKSSLINELEEEIKNKLGLSIQFKDKAMNEGFIFTDEEINEVVIAEEGLKDGVFNDLEAAKKLYELYPYFICCHSVLYVFDDELGLWTDKEEIIFKIISRYNKHLYLLTIDNKGETKKMVRGYGNSTTLKRQMMPELKTLCINNNWMTETQFSSIGKLLFLNGYYDMKNGLFVDKFDPDIVFYYKIYRKYETTKRNANYIKDVKLRFIYNQLGEIVGDYFLLNIARGLAGDMMKKFIFGLGDTNAGKSTIVKGCVSAFGEYIGSFNAENLCFRNSSADESAQMRWALLLRFKRIIFSNEIKMNTEVNGNMIKKISSGGDTLIARVHGGLETEFIPHFLAVSFANDAPKISGIDTDPAINNRLKFISYTKRYVNNPTNEFELKINDNIDNEIETEEFKEAFQFIIFDAYLNFIHNNKNEIEPEEVKIFKSEWVGDGGEQKTITKFLESFEITDNKEQFTISKDIEEWLNTEKIGITITKFSMELKKYCKLKKYNNIESKVKKISGKSKQAWIGIKKLIDEDDEDEPKSALDI